MSSSDRPELPSFCTVAHVPSHKHPAIFFCETDARPTRPCTVAQLLGHTTRPSRAWGEAVTSSARLRRCSASPSACARGCGASDTARRARAMLRTTTRSHAAVAAYSNDQQFLHYGPQQDDSARRISLPERTTHTPLKPAVPRRSVWSNPDAARRVQR